MILIHAPYLHYLTQSSRLYPFQFSFDTFYCTLFHQCTCNGHFQSSYLILTPKCTCKLILPLFSLLRPLFFDFSFHRHTDPIFAKLDKINKNDKVDCCRICPIWARLWLISYP